jgi:integrase/recombinase XerC
MSLVEDYIVTLQVKNFSPETVDTYYRSINEFEKFCEKFKTDLITLTRTTARSYVVELSNREIKPISINNYITSLRLFYNYLVREGKVDVNHFVDIRRLQEGKPLPSFVPYHEMIKLFETVDQSQTFSLRDIAMFECFYGSAVRAMEMCNLKTGDIDFFNEELKIRNGKGGKDRLIPIPEGTLFILRKYMPSRDLRWPTSDYLFPNAHGKRFHPSNAYKIIKSFLDLTTSKKKGPHTLRHSYATHMIGAGAGIREVQELLGHESPETTTKYIHTDTEHLKKIFIQAHPKA